MQHKFTLMGRLWVIALLGAGISCAQQKMSPADQAKLDALKDLRDTGVITAQEYDTKLKAVQASVPASTPPAKPVQAKISWSGTRKAELVDPQYQMTAYTLEVPTNWKYAGTIAREPGCHSNGAALKYTMQSPDGFTAIAMLPGSAWSWSSDPNMQQVMASSKCPAVDLDSAAKFLVNIAVPNLRPNAKSVTLLPLLPEGKAALEGQLQQLSQQNAAVGRGYGQAPQKISLDGARARVQYDRDGQPVEEMISSVVSCTESQLPGLPRQAASTRRTCFSRGTVIVRAPQGHLDELLALPQLTSLSKSVQVNQEWQNRLNRDQQAAFQQIMAAQNLQFQNMLKAGRDANDQMLANGRAQNAARQAGTDRAIAADRAQQAAIDNSAHNTALYSLDRQAFTNPNTGQTIEASSEFNHQWMSSDGSTLIQTNSPSLDPNGVVYPVSQSWVELIPK